MTPLFRLVPSILVVLLTKSTISLQCSSLLTDGAACFRHSILRESKCVFLLVKRRRQEHQQTPPKPQRPELTEMETQTAESEQRETLEPESKQAQQLQPKPERKMSPNHRPSQHQGHSSSVQILLSCATRSDSKLTVDSSIQIFQVSSLSITPGDSTELVASIF